MKHEKILPNGTATPAPRAALRAGGHCSTKMYIAPSKSACDTGEGEVDDEGERVRARARAGARCVTWAVEEHELNVALHHTPLAGTRTPAPLPRA